jgi:Icc-related predicted phosphoesterase
MRIAAVGDLHVGEDSRGTLQPAFAALGDCADVLLLAGDLTRLGTEEEIEVLVDELEAVAVPCVAVLGNHDYESDREEAITRHLGDAGVQVLEGSHAVIRVRDATLGVAGSKGFGGGFAGAFGSDFGEPAMKAFVRHSQALADGLGAALATLDTDVRIALVHYSPTKDTLGAERLEIYPFLGSFLLGEAIDHAGADLVIHGHAHHGVEQGLTPGGVPVRNVAQPVIGAAYKLFTLEPRHPNGDA